MVAPDVIEARKDTPISTILRDLHFECGLLDREIAALLGLTQQSLSRLKNKQPQARSKAAAHLKAISSYVDSACHEGVSRYSTGQFLRIIINRISLAQANATVSVDELRQMHRRHLSHYKVDSVKSARLAVLFKEICDPMQRAQTAQSRAGRSQVGIYAENNAGHEQAIIATPREKLVAMDRRNNFFDLEPQGTTEKNPSEGHTGRSKSPFLQTPKYTAKLSDAQDFRPGNPRKP